MSNPEKIEDAISILNNIVIESRPARLVTQQGGITVAQLDTGDVVAIQTVLKDRHRLYTQVDELRKKVDDLMTELDWYQK